MTAPSTLPKPTVVQHAKRPEWGRGVVIEEQPDRVRFLFEHGGARTFMRGDALIILVDLPHDEATAVERALLRRHKPPPSAGRPKKPRALVAESLTFERQDELFRARFPLGFEDPEYIRQERGTERGRDRYKDAAIARAADLLAPAALDELLASGRSSEVFARAVSVLRATLNLVYPKTEKPAFEAMPAASHDRFGHALRAVLYGEGEYGSRFDAYVSAIDMKNVPWTVATLFPAVVHPGEHVFVKPTFSVRQARILHLDEPPIGEIPTGAGYAEHLAVAQALKDRLLRAGHRPRDMFDVYTFSWITQRLADPSSEPKAQS